MRRAAVLLLTLWFLPGALWRPWREPTRKAQRRADERAAREQVAAFFARERV